MATVPNRASSLEKTGVEQQAPSPNFASSVRASTGVSRVAAVNASRSRSSVVYALRSCVITPGTAIDPQLVEANRLHLEAMKISQQLEQKLDSLSPLAKDGSSEKSQIDSLKNLIEVWEKHVIEVPGFAHEHAHEHGAHEHKTAPPMTDESMLEYQRQSRQAIAELQEAIEKLESLPK